VKETRIYPLPPPPRQEGMSANFITLQYVKKKPSALFDDSNLTDSMFF